MLQQRAHGVARTRRDNLPNLKPDPIAKAAKHAAITETLRNEPKTPLYKVAERHGVHYSTVSRLRTALLAADPTLPAGKPPNGGAAFQSLDRTEKWGRLLSRYAPLKLRAEVLNKLLTSDNPVSAGRALEIVLESDGLRKKIPTPGQQQMIVVAGSDDTGFA